MSIIGSKASPHVTDGIESDSASSCDLFESSESEDKTEDDLLAVSVKLKNRSNEVTFEEFLDACKLGFTELVSKILSLPHIDRPLSKAANKQIIHDALCKVVMRGHEQTALIMLKHPSIRMHAHLHQNHLIELAIQKKMNVLWLSLLRDPLIQAEFLRNIEDIKRCVLLRQAARCGNYEAVYALIVLSPEIVENAAVCNNDALYQAVKNGHETIARELLLPLSVVRFHAHLLDNRVLKMAIKNQLRALVVDLLSIDEVRRTFLAENTRYNPETTNENIVIDIINDEGLPLNMTASPTDSKVILDEVHDLLSGLQLFHCNQPITDSTMTNPQIRDRSAPPISTTPVYAPYRSLMASKTGSDDSLYVNTSHLVDKANNNDEHVAIVDVSISSKFQNHSL